ncbi:hypothetical protein ABW20_dc0100709 [Dactylellina cionopaga]|nr:hypothetical protein ABW20_dc0100709 [Dactylellina cionopaga]
MPSAQILQSFANATNMLLDHGIHLLEWGDQVLLYWGYPIVIPVYDFAVEDSHLEETVNLLENPDPGFKRIDPPLSEKAKGILGERGYHFISGDDKEAQPTVLHILPESLVHLSSHDTSHVHSPFDPSRGLYRPKLPSHCASLIMCMEDYPADSINRWPAERALRILLAAAVYKLPNLGEKIWEPEDSTESEKHFKVRQNAAVRHIEHWNMTEKDEPYRSKIIKFLLTGSID